MRRIVSALTLVLVSACSVNATADSERVQVVKTKEAVAGCLYLGKVVVSGPVYTGMGGFIGGAADRGILRKNKTAEMGGNTLLRLGEDEDDAYLCPAPSFVTSLMLKASKVKVAGNLEEVSGCQRLQTVWASSLDSINMKTPDGEVVRSQPWMDFETRVRLLGYALHADSALLGPSGRVDYYQCPTKPADLAPTPKDARDAPDRPNTEDAN